MPSTQSKLFHFFLRLIRKKTFLGKQLVTGKASILESPVPAAARVKELCEVRTYKVNDRNVFDLSPKNKKAGSTHILYLHGGAYVQSFNRFHWSFLANLVDKTGCTITAPDYPLAPAHTYHDSFEMVKEVYERLIPLEAKDFILMGDSSGGGFALAFAQQLRDEKKMQPARIILLCPWLDLTLTNPYIITLEDGDPFLEKQSLQEAGKLYAGDTDTSHHLLSPINGSLTGLGNISVFMGSKEILLPDARKLKVLAENAGVKLDYYEYEHMVHGWMFLNFPESAKARDEIAALVMQQR